LSEKYFPDFLGEGAHAPQPPLTSPFLHLWVVIGPRSNGFPGPAMALDGPGLEITVVLGTAVLHGLYCQIVLIMWICRYV